MSRAITSFIIKKCFELRFKFLWDYNFSDDPIQLAQRVNSVSDDLFTSLESGALINNYDEVETQTQTFSILNPKLNEESIEINDTEKLFNTNNTESDNVSVFI